MPNSNKHILVVDDDPKVRLLLRRCLETDGYQVKEAANRKEVIASLEQQKFELITLDLNLGEDDGLTIAAEIRANSNVPIIIVTGKGDVIDRVVGLEMGADDYISKPFHIREVLARVKTVMRRSTSGNEQSSDPKPGPVTPVGDNNLFYFEGWQADPSRFELRSPDGEVCELTTADFRLLMVLLKNPKRVLSRDQIMNDLNGLDWTPYDRTVDNQIARLRKKVEKDISKPSLIKTVRGIGYTFAADVEVAKQPATN